MSKPRANQQFIDKDGIVFTVFSNRKGHIKKAIFGYVHKVSVVFVNVDYGNVVIAYTKDDTHNNFNGTVDGEPVYFMPDMLEDDFLAVMQPVAL